MGIKVLAHRLIMTAAIVAMAAFVVVWLMQSDTAAQ